MHYDDQDNMLGEWLDENHYDTVIEESCRVWKCKNAQGERELLCVVEKNAFSDADQLKGYEAFNAAVSVTDNRGIAAGPVSEENHQVHSHKSKAPIRKFHYDVEEEIEDNDYFASTKTKKEEQKKFMRKVIRKDGSVSTTNYANRVEAGIAGYFDRYPRFPFCRETAFTKGNSDKFEMGIPFVQQVSEKFKEHIPNRWKNQKSYIDKTDPSFVIDGTVFSTITVNKNFRTAGHKDAGDLESGFGTLIVVGHSDYTGGYTVIPKYRVAINARPGDFVGMDVHEVHGNTPINFSNSKQGRLSLVCYYREKLVGCNTLDHEKLREKFFGIYGYKAGMWNTAEWEYAQNVGEVKEGMWDTEEFVTWYESQQGSLEQFF